MENVDYLVISSVKVRDHGASLGNESPEELEKLAFWVSYRIIRKYG